MQFREVDIELFVTVKKTDEVDIDRSIGVDCRLLIGDWSCCKTLVVFRSNRFLKAGVDLGAYIGFDDIPHLRFSGTAMAFLREFVVRMHLDGEVLSGVDELNEERELISELLIDAVSDEEPFVLIDELGEVETEVHVADDAALDSYGLMPGHAGYLPRLADIRLRSEDALEGGDLVTTPNGGF